MHICTLARELLSQENVQRDRHACQGWNESLHKTQAVQGLVGNNTVKKFVIYESGRGLQIDKGPHICVVVGTVTPKASKLLCTTVVAMYIPLRAPSASWQPGETPRHLALPSLLCLPGCRENKVGVDESIFDLEWL